MSVLIGGSEINVQTPACPGGPEPCVTLVVLKPTFPGRKSFQSSIASAALSSAALPSISKTASHAGPGGRRLLAVGFSRLIATLFLTLLVILPLATLVLGARVTAIVPMNKAASTVTPKIHFQKLGFLVTVI